MNFNERIQPNKITEEKEDELDIILREYNSRDGSLQEYLKKLKEGDEENVQKYYRIIEKLADLEEKKLKRDPRGPKQTRPRDKGEIKPLNPINKRDNSEPLPYWQK